MDIIQSPKCNSETEATNLSLESSGREAQVAPVRSTPNPNYSLGMYS